MITLTKKQAKSVNPGKKGKVLLIANENSSQPKSRSRKRGRRRVKIQRSVGLSAYARSLLDPWSGAGVKIPDEATQLTSTWQSRTRLVLTCAAGGNTFLNFSPQVPSGAISAVGISGFETPTVQRLSQALANYSTAQSVYSQVRVVSAGVKIACMQNFSANQGILYSALWPRNTPNPSGAQFQASELTAINRFADGTVITFRPMDNADREFYPSTDGPPDTLTTRTGSQFMVLISGYASGAQLLVDFVVNYECIVQPGFSGIVDAEPSPVSASELENAERVGESIPPTAVGSLYEKTIQAGSSVAEKLGAVATPQMSSLADLVSTPTDSGYLPSYVNTAKKWAHAASQIASLAAYAAPALKRAMNTGMDFKTPY